MFSYILHISYVKETGESKDHACGAFCVVCVHSHMSNFMCVSEVTMHVHVTMHVLGGRQRWEDRGGFAPGVRFSFKGIG